MLGFAWFNTLWYVPVFLVSIFQCVPLAMAWDPTIEGTCVDFPVYILIVGIYNIVSDCVMLLIPIVCIWRLQMTWNEKLGVALLFLIGTL
jgi:large subunit ribosomal protein L36e